MGYRDSLDPVRARITDQREELRRQKERVLPTFWRLPQTRALTKQVARVARLTDEALRDATFEELLEAERAFEETRVSFEETIAIAASIEESGASIPDPPAGEAEGRELGPLLVELEASSGARRNAPEAITHEVIVELLRKTREAMPSGARAVVSTRGREWLVRVTHEGVTYRVYFTRKFQAEDIEPFVRFMTVAVPIGTPRMYIKPRGYFDDWLEALGVTQFHTGHEAFDQIFTLKGDAEFLHEVLDLEVRNALLAAQSIDETRIDVHHGWATIYGTPSKHAFDALRTLRKLLHTERYLRAAS